MSDETCPHGFPTQQACIDCMGDGYIDDTLDEVLATQSRGTPVRIVTSREEYEAMVSGPDTFASGCATPASIKEDE